MFEYLIINQVQPQQPAQQPAAPQQAAQQPMQQPVQPAQQPVQPMPGAPQTAPSGNVSMIQMAQWAGIGGAASGAIQAALSVISGFDMVNFLMTIIIGIVVGILSAIILGQFGNKIPVEGTLMVKAAAMMFIINIITGFIFGMGEGTFGMILGVVGIGAGAFVYGWLLQNKIPNLL